MIGEIPYDILCGESEQLNPAIVLAEDLMRRNAAELLSTKDIERAEKVLQTGAREIEVIECHLVAFARSPAASSVHIPVGF